MYCKYSKVHLPGLIQPFYPSCFQPTANSPFHWKASQSNPCPHFQNCMQNDITTARCWWTSFRKKPHNGILLFTYQEQTQDQTIWYVQITILVCFNLVNIKMIIYGPVSACTFLSSTNTRTKSMKLWSKFFNEKFHLWGRGLHSHLHHRHLVSTNVEILQKKILLENVQTRKLCSHRKLLYYT